MIHCAPLRIPTTSIWCPVDYCYTLYQPLQPPSAAPTPSPAPSKHSDSKKEKIGIDVAVSVMAVAAVVAAKGPRLLLPSSAAVAWPRGVGGGL